MQCSRQPTAGWHSLHPVGGLFEAAREAKHRGENMCRIYLCDDRQMEFATGLEDQRTTVIVWPILNPVARLRNRNAIAFCLDLPIRSLLQFVGADCSSNESKETANGEDRIRIRIHVVAGSGPHTLKAQMCFFAAFVITVKWSSRRPWKTSV
jgi:hypothetical protein